MNNPRKPMSEEEIDRLLAQARQMRPATARQEIAFETRLLARLRADRESIGIWSWRLVPWFAAIVLALGIFSWGALYDPTAPVPDSFADWILVQMFFAT
jgi:hypothetical protein